MDEKDQKEINTTMDNLNPDEFLGTQIHKITLESGKTKIVKINSHNLYDKSGVFLQRNFYTQNITEEYYKQNELTVLNETFKDVQKAASISVSYKDADGKYHWTDETYRIIDREPRKGDENTDIVLAYTDKATRSEIMALYDELELNEFLGLRNFSIVSAAGKRKYLQSDVHKIADENGNYLRTTRYTQDITENYLKNQEILTLKSVVEDVQESAVLSVQYMDEDGKYHWTDQTYKIIDRESREGDEDIHIVHEIMIEKDAKDFKKLIAELKPNEYYDKDKVWTIVTESGKVKYIRGKARNIYDDEGNFVCRSEYAQDITEEYLRNQELLSLNAVVDDVQRAANLSVQYMDADGKHHWTDETYRILNREPRYGDEDIHVFADLMDENDIRDFKFVIDNLKLGEYYDEGRIWPITTESGKVKYVKGSARKIYDDEGHFVRRSEFAQDVTD